MFPDSVVSGFKDFGASVPGARGCGCLGFRDSVLRGFAIPGCQGSGVSAFQNLKIPGFENVMFVGHSHSRTQGFQVFRCQAFRIP